MQDGQQDLARALIDACLRERSPLKAFRTSLDNSAIGGPMTNQVDLAFRNLDGFRELAWATAEAYTGLHSLNGGLQDGVVFTPPWLAEKVVERLIPGIPVVDLGAGTGMLTLAAAARGFDVIAIESDPDLAWVLRSLSRVLHLTDRIEVRVEDALSFRRSAPAQIMTNPPFTRHHSLSARRKRALSNLSRNLGVPLLQTSGYYAYFMVYGWTAPWSQREVFLLPTNWLEARYGSTLRRTLRERSHRIEVIENGRHAPVFNEALTNACLLTTWSSPNRTRGARRNVAAGESPAASTSVERTLRISALLGPAGRKRSATERDSVSAAATRIEDAPPDGRRTLGEFLAIHRGIATGNNGFFVLTDSRARELGLPAPELTRIVRRFARGSGTPQLANLWSPGRPPSKASMNLIARGARSGANVGYLCSHRKPWWRIEIVDPPPYFLSYMGRESPRVVANRLGLLNLNNTHGVYFKEGADERDARIVVRWLSSQPGRRALSRRARHFFGGMWKLEPREVSGMPLPVNLARTLHRSA